MYTVTQQRVINRSKGKKNSEKVIEQNLKKSYLKNSEKVISEKL